MEILFVNESISILVDHVESFFEFLNLRLVKHGKNIGCRSLGTFLCGLCFGPFAGHFGFWEVCACFVILDKSLPKFGSQFLPL